MSDEESPNVQESIDTVAKQIAWRIFDPEDALWEDYPDIGEHDWERVLEAVENLCPTPPDLHSYRESYEYLTRRAGGSGS